MVALNHIEIVQQDKEQCLGIKKSKKKKNKCQENETVIDSAMETAKISALKEMDIHVEHLTKKKKKKSHKKDKATDNSDNHSNGVGSQNSDEKEKHKIKKEKRKKEKIKNREKMMETENPNEDESKVEKTQKRKHTEEEQICHDKNGTLDQNVMQPKKKKHKKSVKNEPDEEERTETRKKKKSKKSKQEKTNNDNSVSSNDSVTYQVIENTDKIKHDDAIVPDDIDAIKKKNKKNKKAKKEKENGNSGNQQIDIDPVVRSDISSKSGVDSSTFKKDFYSDSYISDSHDHEKEKAGAEQYRQQERITMFGKGKTDGQFHPIRDFKKLGFEENLLTAVKNFKEPTPIQASAWPVIASGRDTIGIAETGSGKTLAFSIPALAHMKHRLSNEQRKKRRGPMMLVVAPTRELAQQSQDVLEDAGKKCGIRSVSVYGGVSKDSQRRALSANAAAPFEVVVATPGKCYVIDICVTAKSCLGYSFPCSLYVAI